MDELLTLREELERRPAPWQQLPDFPLYMDQVLSYMTRQLPPYTQDDALTAAMVNNYAKSGLLPRAAGKKYTREHLARLTAICALKQVLSTRDIELLLSTLPQEDAEEGYAAFCESLDRSLNLVSDTMEGYASPEDAAQAALHFALLSYAAGLAASRYIAHLRSTREGFPPAKKPGRKKKTAPKEEM